MATSSVQRHASTERVLEPLLLRGGLPAPQRLPSEAERRDALAALVGSALSHLAKQPLLVCHLARHVGLLLLMCKEVLAVATTSRVAASWQPGAGRQQCRRDLC
jgi:hypothetical protein